MLENLGARVLVLEILGAIVLVPESLVLDSLRVRDRVQEAETYRLGEIEYRFPLVEI